MRFKQKTGSVFSENQWFQINGKANMYQRETQILCFQFTQNKQPCLVSVFVVDLITSQVVGPFQEACIYTRN